MSDQNINYAKYIDNTLLKQDASKEAITKLCLESVNYGFKSVCVNPVYVSYCASLLEASDVLVCTVIGFPLGANTTKVKVLETKNAIKNGADEIDMVINVSKLKDKEDQYVLDEIKAIKKACGKRTLKVIIETCLLTNEEKVRACKLSKEAGADFVKTSTGFSTGGATVEDVKLMKETVGEDMEVKASGGVKTKEDFLKMIEAGATRIGTSSGAKLL